MRGSRSPGAPVSDRRSRRGPGRARPRGQKPPPSNGRLPKSSYREYIERCESAGREPADFMTYLEHARRWRLEYAPARERGDAALARELEDLLCEQRRPNPVT